ncbi:MAG: hypothetical protein VX731_02795 [Candidatus Neomarinimicrobiota bacterium]|nr:hypothetical protein [Candidatus Neomarinimicrobiota bacterium]
MTITIPSGVQIELSGEVEVEFIDVEGKGGAGNRETFLKKIETRSPHTRIDKAVLDLKVIYSQSISYRFSLRFDDNGAYADKHYLLFKKEDLRVELGKNRPAIALKRKIEGYPLIGTAYWKGRQYHIDISNNYSIFEYGASFALKRPLSYDDAVEDKSFRMLVYGDTEKVDGQTYEIGLRAGLKFRTLRLQSWFYTGKLIDDEDWKKRLHYDFDYYANLEPDNVLSKDANIDHSWYGARGELDIFNTLLRGEFIGSIDGYLKRQGYYGEVSSNLRNNLLILLRYGELRIDPGGNDFFPQLKDPQTWDRKLLTLASVYDITSYAKLKVEYYLLDEVTGDRDEDAKTERRDYQPNVKDNQLLIQFELNF